MALVQTCEVDENEASYFLTTVDDETITKSLYNANGKCGNVGVSSTKNQVTKCDFSMKGQPVPISFSVGQAKKTVVADIDVMCFTNNRYGVVVAMNNPSTEDEEPVEEQEGDGFMTKREKAAREERTASAPRSYNNVELYIENYRSVFKLYRQIRVYGEITCMRVLISPVDMPSQRQFLSAKIGLWPNIVAIGCKRSTCYIGQFSNFDPDNPEHWASDDIIETTATTDTLKSLITGHRFNYRDGHNPHYFNKDDEQVTAVSYIPCYGVVLVGLSNGCIVIVPLDGKSCISCLTVPYSTPINFLVVLEPEFDPAGGFYVFSARARPQVKHKNACLVVFSHKISRKEDETGAYEYQDMSTVMIPMKDGDYWVNVHGIVKKRKRREADSSNDSTGEHSQFPEGLNTTQHMLSDGMERTLLFYSYITLKGEMKGGLFDLNCWYTRRCGTMQVRFDEYGQDPICSQFTLSVPRKNTGDPLFRAKDIAWVHCESISRYTSPLFDRDPLFQPMAASLSLVIHTYGKYAYAATVDSLQYTVLDRIAHSLSASLAQPDLAVSLLERVGLVLAPTTKKERLRMEERPANERVPTELDKIMRAIVSDVYIRKQLIKFIESCTDRKQLLHVGRWMFNELREIVVRMDESIAPLFDAVAPELLSKDAKEMIGYCPAFFEFAELVFWKVRGRGQELANDTTRLRFVRKIHALMAFDLRLFLASVKWMTRKLPMCEGWTSDLLEEVAELSGKRRERARRERRPLFLDALLARLHEKTMEDGLWRGLDEPIHWYPPPRFNLVSLLRQNAAPLADRAALVFYYLMDVDEAVRRDRERPEDEKRGYPVKDSLIRSFLIWEAGKLIDGEGCDGVRERWESDMKGAASQKENQAANDGHHATQAAAASRLTEEEKEELGYLLKVAQAFRKLQKVDEDRMKVLMNKQDFGPYRFNLFLIKKARYPEVEDLPIPSSPSPSTHRVVAEYAKYKGMAMAQKAQLPPPTHSNAFACPYTITKAAPTSDANSTMNASRIVRSDHVTIRGKTPKKLNIFRRLTTAPTAASTSAAAAAADVQSTPPSRTTQAGEASTETARINALMKTPSMRFRNQQEAVDEEDEEEGRENDSNVAPDEMARVREALRTPRSRAALAARGAAGEGTPEDAPRPAVTVPMSILKSAHKESRLPQSLTKSKLRFANVFDEKSISPRERDNSASTCSMSQPNFDDSFEDSTDQILSKSTNHATPDALNLTTRLEREIEEEEERKKAARRGEEPEEESMDSMESGDLPPLSSGDEGEEVTEESEERIDDDDSTAAAAAIAARTFDVYHDSEGSAASSSTEDEAEAAFVEEDKDDSVASAAEAAAAGDAPAALVEAAAEPKTPPPTPEEEEPNLSRAVTPVDEDKEDEEEEVPPPVVAGDEGEKNVEEDENVSRAETPVDEEEEKQKEESEERTLTPQEGEKEEEAAAPAAELPEEAAASLSSPAGSDHSYSAPAVSVPAAVAAVTAVGSAAWSPGIPSTPDALNESVTYVNATFVIDLRGDRHRPPTAAAAAVEAAGEEEEMEEEEEAAAAADETEAPEKQPEPVEAAAEAAEPAAPAEEEKEEEEANLSRAITPVEGEKEGEGEGEVPPPVAAVDDEGEKNEEEENVSRAETPVEEEEEKDEDEEENVSRAETPVEEREEEEEKEEEAIEEETEEAPVAHDKEEEEVAAPVAAAAAPAARQPPIPKPRTVFPSRAEPMSLGLRSYIYMEDGIEKSYEEQRDDSDEEKEEGEQQGDILARLSPRRSSSRLQQQRGETSAASGGRKRTASRSRKDSEKEAAGPSTSASPRGKKERREEEEKEKEEGEGEGHLFTTTRTRVVEERYVEREDGVLQHTVKQSTKVVEMADGVVTKNEQEDKETIEEEGDREEGEEVPDEADRVTPPMVEAAAEPSTGRKSSRVGAAANRSRTQPVTPSKAPPTLKKEEKKREEKATTPLRSPAKSAPRRLKLMSSDESEQKEEEKEKEPPLTPRRSTRVRNPSESTAASTVSVTPSKSPRRSGRVAKTPSREPSAAPVSPRRRLVLDDTDEEAEKKKGEEKEEKDTAAPTPRKRGRPRKEPVEDAATPALLLPAKRKTMAIAASTAGSARKRSASESVKQKKEEEEKDEEMEDAIAALRRRRDQSRIDLAEKKKADEKRKAGRASKLVAIPEDSEAKISAKKSNEEEEEGPSTSQAVTARSPARRKRSQSETGVKMEKEPVLKTPAKKKTKTDDKEGGEDVGDQSMLRRSTRKAAVSANEVMKTPSKSSRGK